LTHSHLAELASWVAEGEHQVDSETVAEAILRRFSSVESLSALGEALLEHHDVPVATVIAEVGASQAPLREAPLDRALADPAEETKAPARHSVPVQDRRNEADLLKSRFSCSAPIRRGSRIGGPIRPSERRAGVAGVPSRINETPDWLGRSGGR